MSNIISLRAEFAEFEYVDGKVVQQRWREDDFILNLDQFVFISPSDDYPNIWVMAMTNNMFMISGATKDKILMKIARK